MAGVESGRWVRSSVAEMQMMFDMFNWHMFMMSRGIHTSTDAQLFQAYKIDAVYYI